MTTAGVTTEVTIVGGIAMSVVGLGAEVQGNTGSTLMLFAPTVSHSAIQIADGVIDCGDGGCTTLVIENHGTEKLIFKRRMVLGTVCPVDEVETPAAGINSGDKISSNTQETTTRRELPLLQKSQSTRERRRDKITREMESRDPVRLERWKKYRKSNCWWHGLAARRTGRFRQNHGAKK